MTIFEIYILTFAITISFFYCLYIFIMLIDEIITAMLNEKIKKRGDNK